MSQYWLPCECGQRLRVAAAEAGGEVACACGKRLAVPTLRGIRHLEPVVDQPTKAGPAWSRVHGAIFASGLVLISVGLALVAYNGFYYSQLGFYAVDRSDEVIAEYAGQLDKITPTEALDLWQTEFLEHGLGERQDPPWVQVKARRGELLRWIQAGAAALAVGLVMALGSLVVGRR